MPEVFDKESGQVVQVSAQEAQAGFQAGRFGLPRTGRLNVVDEGTGELVNVDAAQAVEALAPGSGMRLADDEEVQEQRLEQEFGEGLATLQAGAEGAARGLTFGGSDALLRAAGVDAEGLRERRERNPVASLGGEAVGAIAPTLLTGGTGALGLGARGTGIAARAAQAGRMAGVVPRAVVSAGRATERGVQGLLGARGGGILGRGLSMGAAGTVEGAAFGAGQAVSEAALQDSELTAERVVAHMGRGALLGGTAGSVLGAGSQAASRAAERLGPELQRITRRGNLEGFIGSSAFRAAKGPGGGKRWVEKAKQTFGDDGVAQVGRELLDEGVVTARSTIDDIARQADQKRQRWGRRIGSVLEEVDQGGGQAPSLQRIEERVRGEVINPLRNSPLATNKRVARSVERELEGLFGAARETVRRGGQRRVGEVVVTSGGRGIDPATGFATGAPRTPDVGFAQLHKFRSELDDVAYRVQNTSSPHTKELRRARDIIEQEIESSIDKAVQQTGREDLVGAYQQAKRKYKAMKLGSDMAQDAVSRADANRMFSLSDMQTAQAVGIGGAFGAGGIEPGTMALAFASGALHKFWRERGAAITSAALNNMTKMQALSRRAQTVEQRSQQAVKRFFDAPTEITGGVKGAKPTSVTRGKGKGRRELYEDKVQELQDASKDLEAVADRIARHTVDVQGAAPKFTHAFTQTVIRGQQFLQAKLPQPKVRASTLRPDLDKTQRVSDAEMAKWLRYEQAVSDPSSVFEHLENGDLSREEVEALREVYPSMHEALVTQVFEEVGRLDKAPPYSKLVQLSIAIGQPLHPTLEPGFLSLVQQRYAAKAQEIQQQPMAPSARKAPDLSGKKMAGTTAALTRGLSQ